MNRLPSIMLINPPAINDHSLSIIPVARQPNPQQGNVSRNITPHAFSPFIPKIKQITMSVAKNCPIVTHIHEMYLSTAVFTNSLRSFLLPKK